MTFVASCVQPAGISTSFCSNISLPLSSLIWAERNSHCTESNGSASSGGQNSAAIERPFDSSRRPSGFVLRGERVREAWGALVWEALTVAMSQLLAEKGCPGIGAASFLLGNGK